MKKIYTLIAAIIFSAGMVSAQCTNDTSTAFFSPAPDSLPCIDSGVAYNQTVHVYLWDSLNLQTIYPFSVYLTQPFWLHMDSLVVDSITGFPTGITDQFNPANGHIYPQTHACYTISGTTFDTTGTYPLHYWGTMSFYTAGYPGVWPAGDTTISLQFLQSNARNPFTANLNVIQPGSACRPTTGINDFSSELNSSLSVYPNPNNGMFEVQINAGRRLNGEIVVLDMSGRRVYTQQLDITGLYNNAIDLGKCASGLYILQLRTPEGFASKKISIQ